MCGEPAKTDRWQMGSHVQRKHLSNALTCAAHAEQNTRTDRHTHACTQTRGHKKTHAPSFSHTRKQSIHHNKRLTDMPRFAITSTHAQTQSHTHTRTLTHRHVGSCVGAGGTCVFMCFSYYFVEDCVITQMMETHRWLGCGTGTG